MLCLLTVSWNRSNALPSLPSELVVVPPPSPILEREKGPTSKFESLSCHFDSFTSPTFVPFLCFPPRTLPVMNVDGSVQVRPGRWKSERTTPWPRMEGSACQRERERARARSRSPRFLTPAHHEQKTRDRFIVIEKQVVDILKNRFLLACVHDEAAFACSKLAKESLTYSIDRELVRKKKIDFCFDSPFFRPRLFSFLPLPSLPLGLSAHHLLSSFLPLPLPPRTTLPNSFHRSMSRSTRISGPSTWERPTASAPGRRSCSR